MYEDCSSLILAIDPGRAKCGVALVSFRAEVVSKMVVPRDEVVDMVRRLLNSHDIGPLVVGDRTGSRQFCAELAAACLPGANHEVITVNEHLTSQEGRQRYLKEHPGRGLSRLLPLTLRTPETPYDDYVAVILAERYLAGRMS